MSGESQNLSGPDLAQGITVDDLAEGAPLLGQAHGEAVMLVRRGEEVFAIGAQCTHYGGPLAEGLVVGDTVRCPWHHACFSLRTGEAVKAPALKPIACYQVVRQGDLVRVGDKLPAPEPPPPETRRPAVAPTGAVVVGAGGAGAAAVEALRRGGFAGSITLLGAEPPGPVDRPNLSKDYLAGNAPEEWIPLRDAAFYEQIDVELLIGDPARSLDLNGRRVTLESGRAIGWDSLLLATGARARRLPIPGADRPDVHTLRTLADSRAIIARATAAKRAVVVGASFIGLEVAASLRARGVEVAVVAPDKVPLGRILGDEVGAFVRGLHEAKGVRFHFGRKPAAFLERAVDLDDGSRLECDFVVLGVGVEPRVELAAAAGLAVDNGVAVNEYLEAAPGVWAAGDVARYPDRRSGKPVRIEHWVVAERMGQAAARNMLGAHQPYRDVPFFWSAHYDVTLSYVGHAESWDQAAVHGSLADREATVVYRQGGRILAVLTVGRDRVSLDAEAAMERGDEDELERLAD
jgi:NADPH-dependent 2,4-dienoyl-CoA reductase/sulfur reductase-like enzyme/nitrite reductase/ring-hydroxylating ferredoxin subunit